MKRRLRLTLPSIVSGMNFFTKTPALAFNGGNVAVKLGILCLTLYLGAILQGCAPAAGTPENTANDDYFADDDYDDDLASGLAGDRIDKAGAGIADPLEPWNRFWFDFNDVFIEYLARPVAAGYEAVTPSVVRQGIRNFFHNLRAPLRIVNCLLQGKGQEAGVEFSSFLLNSVWGLGGVFDLASDYESVVPAMGADFGQTLGRWGMGEGFYLVLPFMGPSSLRDALGALGGYGMNVLTWDFVYPDISWAGELGISATERVNTMGDTVRSYESLKSIAVDPYTAMRDGYTKLRRNAITR